MESTLDAIPEQLLSLRTPPSPGAALGGSQQLTLPSDPDGELRGETTDKPGTRVTFREVKMLQQYLQVLCFKLSLVHVGDIALLIQILKLEKTTEN